MFFALFFSFAAFAEDEKLSVAVLNFEADESLETSAALVHSKLVNVLSRDEQLVTIDLDDVKKRLDLEAQKALVENCDTSACLSELADAFGADLMVHGRLGKVGTRTVLSMQLYESKDSRSVGRVDRDAKDAGDFLSEIDEMANELFEPRFDIDINSRPSALFWTGGSIGTLGLGVGIVAGGFAIADELVLSDRASSGQQKKKAEERALVLEVVAVIGVAVAIIGGAMTLGGLE